MDVLNQGTENVGSPAHLQWHRCVMSHSLCCPHYPDTGLWKGGKFQFEVSIPEEYNMKVCVLVQCHVT